MHTGRSGDDAGDGFVAAQSKNVCDCSSGERRRATGWTVAAYLWVSSTGLILGDQKSVQMPASIFPTDQVPNPISMENE